MSAHPQPKITPEEYLKIERAAEFKSEYYDGHMFAMSGASYAHVVITGNFSRALGNALEARGCFVGSNDMRVQVSPMMFTYPDVVVTCGKPLLADSQMDLLTNPSVVVEVLSPSTERDDRGLKLTRYRTIPPLQEYVLVSQEEARVEVFRRQPTGQWLLTDFTGPDAICRLESIQCSVPLSVIYRSVDFGVRAPETP
jgi:Uma2 family endonuclease